MTLLIAILIIHGLDLSHWLYPLSFIVWVCSLPDRKEKPKTTERNTNEKSA